jgi:hypothetical protein
MEGVLLSLVHVFGYVFVLTGTTGIFYFFFSICISFNVYAGFVANVFTCFVYTIWICFGFKTIKTNFDYASVAGLTWLILSCTCLAVGTCGSIIGSIELYDRSYFDKIELFGRLVFYVTCLTIGLV